MVVRGPLIVGQNPLKKLLSKSFAKYSFWLNKADPKRSAGKNLSIMVRDSKTFGTTAKETA